MPVLRPYILHYRTSGSTMDNPKLPLPEMLQIGEIALNYNANHPALFTKKNDDTIAVFIDRERIIALDTNVLNTAKEYTDDEIAKAISSVYRFLGTVENYEDLPETGNTIGDVWNVTNPCEISGQTYPAGTNWAWAGDYWDALGGTQDIDLSNYLAKDNADEYTPTGDYNPATKFYVDVIGANLEDAIATAQALAEQGIKDAAAAAEAATAAQETADSKYLKPASGIPKSDLDAGVQESLDKADSAVQPEDVPFEYGDGLNSAQQKGTGAQAKGDGTFAVGYQTQAKGTNSTAEGSRTTAIGETSHAEGMSSNVNQVARSTSTTTEEIKEEWESTPFSIAKGRGAHVEGNDSLALGEFSHAEGDSNIVEGTSAHGEGALNVVSGQAAHAEGYQNTATGNTSHAEGFGTTASGHYSHSGGKGTQAIGDGSFVHGADNGATEEGIAEGTEELLYAKAEGYASHAEGSAYAKGNYSHAEGGGNSIVDGKKTVPTAEGTYSHAEGTHTYAAGESSHAEGSLTDAIGDRSHAEGLNTIASGDQSHTEGKYTKATASHAHAEGFGSDDGSVFVEANGIASHAEGEATIANGRASHAEGAKNSSIGNYSHSEGNSTTAAGAQAHSEGYGSINESTFTISGAANSTTYTSSSAHGLSVGSIIEYNGTHAFVTSATGSTIFTVNKTLSTAALSNVRINIKTSVALGTGAHTEGYQTIAAENHSHAEGSMTRATGEQSHAQGYETRAYNNAEHAEGRWNKSNVGSSTFGNAGNTIHSVGIGSSEANRKNAFEIMQNGDVYINSVGGYDGTNPSESNSKSIQNYIKEDIVKFIDELIIDCGDSTHVI